MRQLKLTSLFLFVVLTCLSGQSYIYFSNPSTNAIERANLDGSNVIELVPNQNTPRGMAIDVENGFLYFCDAEDNSISRVSTSGGAVESIHFTAIDAPADIAYDPDNDVLYYTVPFESTIHRFDIASQTDEIVLSALNLPSAMSLDLVDNKIYWVENGAKLFRANLDGSDEEELAERNMTRIYVDPSDDKLYWTSRDEELVYRSGTDLEDIETISAVSPRAGGVFLDHVNDKLYWLDTELGRVYRSEPDGSDIVSLVRHTEGMAHVILDIRPVSTFTENPTEKVGIKVSPNPSNSFINLSAEEFINQVRIVSVDGKVVFESAVNGFQQTINSSKLLSGTYSVQIETSSGVYTEKLVIQH